MYAVNEASHSMPVRFHLKGVPVTVSHAIVHTIEDHEHTLTPEVMNSRDDDRVSLGGHPLSVAGSTFDFLFAPLGVTLLELSLAESRPSPVEGE